MRLKRLPRAAIAALLPIGLAAGVAADGREALKIMASGLIVAFDTARGFSAL